jgi:nitroreductase
MSNYIDSLKWRYATKKFDKSRKLSEKQLNDLKEVLRLSASSYGLQPYKFLIIENPEIRKKLREASYNQPQITDSSQLIVFCGRYDADEKDVAAHVENTAKTIGKSVSDLEGLSKSINGKLSRMEASDKENWVARQNYLALGNLLSAAAHMGIDACPMEGFENEKYDEILDLKSKGLKSNVIATVGFRDDDDSYASQPKVRKSQDDLFIEL